MAELTYLPFASNARILSVAAGGPPLQWGEPDHAAVKILQQAIIAAGFPIEKGADGNFGRLTAEAIRAFEAKYRLGPVSGVAGRAVIAMLDEILGGRSGSALRQGVTVVSATLTLMLQRTPGAIPVKLTHYLQRTMELCDEYGLKVRFQDRQHPPIDFPGTYDPAFDVSRIRKASEKHTVGQSSVLRVIMAAFDAGSLEWGVTEGAARAQMPVRDFVVLNTAKVKVSGNTLLHEMIHATGLSVHDSDPASVFAQGEGGLTFKPEHAARVSTAFYSDRRP
ncbi:peptidoglycan-binding domain-containing protein [Methylobacterium nodulans]|uniref:Peptidoglycan-binding domain 1 protein n=1 Tax=Methylobacterium nodulans (strain LMG 21967 / CNCM I-2342 / ORS 2060) TaxID=460265 RepID=B8IIA3_METNO|nr:peptidoglycan-binding domain-containing protein [Methylobacterium nodulans]ACL57972.1 Peptidoglycan-binding domain 1 protein [Methylobacterium nodulans ORS 2060]